MRDVVVLSGCNVGDKDQLTVFSVLSPHTIVNFLTLYQTGCNDESCQINYRYNSVQSQKHGDCFLVTIFTHYKSIQHANISSVRLFCELCL